MSIQVAHRAPHDLPVRSGRPAVAPRRPAAAGAPVPDTRSPPTRCRSRRPSHFINWQQDPFGNHLARLVFPEPATRAHRSPSTSSPTSPSINPFDFFVEEYAEALPVRLRARARRATWRRTSRSTPPGPLVRPWLELGRRAAPTTAMRIVDFLVAVNQRLQRDIAYIDPHGARACRRPRRRSTRRCGSCRDSGWLLVQVLRHLGLAARFVSGYLVQLTRRRDAARRARRARRADFTDLHAWAEVFVPGAGWIGLDPTSGLFAGEGHIPLACTPDRRPVPRRSPGPPSRARSTFEFANTVQPRARGPAGHLALHRRAVGRRSTRSATPSTRAASPATCA